MVVGASLGEMLIPLIVTNTIAKHVSSFVIVEFVCSLIISAILLFIFFNGRFTQKYIKEKEEQDKPVEVDLTAEISNLEIVTLDEIQL